MQCFKPVHSDEILVLVLLVCKLYRIKCKAINSNSHLLGVTPDQMKNSMRSNKKENFEILFESMRGIWNEVMLHCIWSNRRAAPQSTDVLRFWIKEASCLAHDFAAFMHLILIYLVLHGLWDILSNCLLHFNKNFNKNVSIFSIVCMSIPNKLQYSFVASVEEKGSSQ